MPSPTPNFDGFADAQRRLRQQFGHELPWITPNDRTWPEGVELNPETAEPYDPTIEPTTSGETQTIVNTSVVSRQISGSGKDQVSKKALGWLEEGGVVFIVDTTDYHLVRDATEVEYAGDRYTIRDDAHDFLGPVDRWLFWGTM